MVDVSFISARFLGANDADEPVAAPGVHHAKNFRLRSSESNPANFAIVLSVVDPLQDLVGEDFCSRQEGHAVFGKVGSGLLFVPLELQFHAARSLA